MSISEVAAVGQITDFSRGGGVVEQEYLQISNVK